MEFSKETYSILLLLLPGFLASGMYTIATVRIKPISTPERIIEALLWTAAITTSAHVLNVQGTIFLDPGAPDGSLPPALDFVVLLALVVLLPTVVAAAVNYSLYSKVLSKLGLSKKRTFLRVWESTFAHMKSWVTIDLKDGRRLMGWPTFYPEKPEEGWLYLTEAVWITCDREGGEQITTEVVGDGILIRVDEDIERIIFTSVKKANVGVCQRLRNWLCRK